MTNPGSMILTALLRRALQAVGVTLAVTTACFAMVQALPGDIAYRIAAGRYGYDRVDTAAADLVREAAGLDRSAAAQLWQWLIDLAHLDLGRSLVTGEEVTHEVAHALTGSVQLAVAALALALVLGVGLGLAAARRPGGALDRLTHLWVAASRTVPPFLLGLILILVFSVQLGWLPAAGHDQRSSVLLPALTLAVGLSGPFARVTRDAVVRARAAAYVDFARTRGLSERSVVVRHVLRNASSTVVAYVGVQALILVEGVIVVESLFAWPGLGHLLVHGIFWRDIPSVQAAALALALLVVVISTLVDLATLALDPRPRRTTA
ncbi:ABC transporter permease [Nocardioides cavernaquae]|uniref:ABC transporter permease n=1 Tax=Nocardioides cavernaquae TaxID=2321396 RepID=A0A3A5HAW6_9ACTN|nr:ABC transporter permease [Nocardioides cavernaquae]RJS47789.1 ABC transporter permease [Nocardioides cavernaquae]